MFFTVCSRSQQSFNDFGSSDSNQPVAVLRESRPNVRFWPHSRHGSDSLLCKANNHQINTFRSAAATDFGCGLQSPSRQAHGER